jgi:putative hydrolase of the HAD superfamily
VTPGRRAARRKPTALLLDLDGVLRRFDPARTAGVEQRFGLAPGSLWRTAFAVERVHPAVTGRVTHAAWMAGVAEALGSPEAVAEWQSFHGTIDSDVLALVGDVRAAGFPVALVTNATDRLDADLAALGVADAFDAVVNASVVGYAKPHPEFYAAACRAVDRPPSECLLLDDSERFVAGARAAGLMALRYTGPADLAYVRAALGV